MPSKIKKRGKGSYLLTVTPGMMGKESRLKTQKSLSLGSMRGDKRYGRYLAEVKNGQVTSGN